MAAAAMLVLASAGCTGPRRVAMTPPVARGLDQPAVPVAPLWWRKAGDPVLTMLEQQGLDSSAEIACRVSGLRHYEFQTTQEQKRIGVKLGRLLGADQKAAADAHALVRQERVQRVVARRIRVARQIALAYVEVRRLQQEVAVRSGLRSQYRDNAEVAQFRREAGLVSAIDGALARSQDQAAQGELAYAQSRLNDAMSELAALVGDTPEALVQKLGTPAPIPLPPVAALADDMRREARLVKALEEARRTVRDARGAYRQGAGEYATLYVAEAAVTAVNLALINARASRMTATLDLWSGQDAAWGRAGLDPVVDDPTARDSTITVTADCD